MTAFKLDQRWAVVTGASSGIGAELARELASAGCHLFLVARRETLLNDLAAELMQKYQVKCEVVALDLTSENAAERLVGSLKAAPVSIVVNNAGFGVSGPFERHDMQEMTDMLLLNVVFLTRFTRLMYPKLLASRNGARILNVGSIAGEQGVPYMPVYAATKAFVNGLTEGLFFELPADSSLKVTALLPGKTESQFFDVAKMRESRFVRGNVMSAAVVARLGIQAMIKGQPRLIAGWTNWATILVGRFSPRWLVRKTMRQLFGDLSQ